MAEINNRFKVKKGLDVAGDTTLDGDLNVTGTATVVNQPQTDVSTKVANTNYVRTAIADLIDSSPESLNTLNELAAALGNDPNFATTVMDNIATKAPIASPELTGIPKAPTATAGTSTTQIATTAFVTAADSLKADILSPTLTGVPKAPTAAVNTSTEQIATTAFVTGQAGTVSPNMDSIAKVGTSTKFAREDHTHPSDSTKANLSGETFTGAISVPGLTSTEDISITGAKSLKNTNNDLVLKTVTAKDIIFQTADSSEKMRLKNSGNLLIGTTTDNGSDKLQVNGNINATSYSGHAVLTGVPTAPTAVAGNKTTQIATTDFVTTADNLKADINNPTFTGNVKFTGGLGSDENRIILSPGGGYFSGYDSSGAIKIRLPVSYKHAMIMMKVWVHEHISNRSFEMVVHGFMNETSLTWYGVGAYMIGAPTSKTPSVRFGNDGDKCCVWIGETNDSYLQPKVVIREVFVGNGADINGFYGGWEVSLVSTFDTVKLGPNPPLIAAGTDSPEFTGIPKAPTAVAGNNTTQLATTSFVQTAVSNHAMTQLIAGNGLTGGGDLSSNKTITLGTPSQITASTSNSVTSTSHTHAIDKASTTVSGVVQLNDTLTSTSTVLALTAAQGKKLQDEKLNKSSNLSDLTNSGTARTNLGLGTASVLDAQSSETDITAGRVSLAGNVVFANNNHNKDHAVFEAIANSPNAWNAARNYTAFFRSNNNGLAILVDGILNRRSVILQSGHSSSGGAHDLGSLHLNKLGGDVTINGHTAYHAGNFGNIDNTSDLNKPVSTATQTALNLKANIASPTFTGSPKAPTAALGTNTTQLATTAFVMNEMATIDGGTF